jgi:hypothetical protein
VCAVGEGADKEAEDLVEKCPGSCKVDQRPDNEEESAEGRVPAEVPEPADEQESPEVRELAEVPVQEVESPRRTR